MRLGRASLGVLTVLAVAGATVGSGSASAASDYRISVHRTPAKIAYGHSIRLGGKVSGGPVRGRAVRIYAGVLDDATGGEEHRVGTAQLSPHGYFHFSYRPPSGGDWRLDVRKSAVGSHGAADQESDVTAVYQWADLGNYESEGSDEEGPDGATISSGTAEIDGKAYPKAILVNDGASLDYTTSNFGCKLVRGATGITSSSPQSAGTLTFAGAKFVGVAVHRQQAPVSFQLALSPDSGFTLSARIGPHGDGTDGGTANTVALLHPQVWCDAPKDAQGSF